MSKTPEQRALEEIYRQSLKRIAQGQKLSRGCPTGDTGREWDGIEKPVEFRSGPEDSSVLATGPAAVEWKIPKGYKRIQGLHNTWKIVPETSALVSKWVETPVIKTKLVIPPHDKTELVEGIQGTSSIGAKILPGTCPPCGPAGSVWKRKGNK
jgi:hypothetical protein